MRRFMILICIVVLALGADAYAMRLAEREVSGNGMVLLHAQKKNLPVVTIILAIKAGSIAEPADRPGLAYMTASLLNEGTKSRSSGQISEAIEFVGGQLNIEANTEYATVTLTVLKKDIELGFDLLSDVILNPLFSDNELARKKRIIRNRLLQQNEEPGTVASVEFARAVFGDHPYGRQVQGTPESVEKISRQDIAGFHAAYYAPNNSIMSVAGDISAEELRKLVGKYFGTWMKKDIREISLPAAAPKKDHETIKISRALTQANIILGHLGIARSNPDYYAVSVMNYILGGGGFGSRLMDNIRDSRGLAYDVHSYFSSNRYGGSFQAGLQTKNETANLAIGELLKEINRIRAEPVSDSELADAKSYLTGSFPLRIDSSSKIASFNLAVEYYGLGHDYAERYPDIINSITKEDILRAAEKYLDPKKYVLVVVGNIEQTGLNY